MSVSGKTMNKGNRKEKLSIMVKESAISKVLSEEMRSEQNLNELRK